MGPHEVLPVHQARGFGDNSLLLCLLLGLEFGMKCGLQFLEDNDWVARSLELGL